MKKNTIVVFCAAAVMSVSMVATAFAERVDLVIGSGGESGTYYPVMSEISEFCTTSTLGINHNLDPEGKSVGGSVKNKRNLLNNKIMGGIIQADVAHLEKMKNTAMKRVLGLLPLHQEPVHVIVPDVVQVMVQAAKPGKFGFGAQDAVYAMQSNQLQNISQLTGHKVASWGGSVTSSKVIKMMGDINFEIVPVDNKDAAMRLLDSGQVSAVVSVVGAPAEWVEALPQGKYKLLSVTENTQTKLIDIYSISSINYDNMGKTGQSIDALAVDAILFTRTYRTPKMVQALGELQSCVKEKIYEIQDTPGTHQVWQNMKWDNLFTAPTQTAQVSE